MSFSFSEFIHRYYLDPVINDSGYNIFNTLTWAVILGIAVFLLMKFFSATKTKIDRRFIFSTLPFVIGGASLRVVADAGIIKAPWVYFLITPNIYFVVFLIAFSSLIVSLALTHFKLTGSYHKVHAGIGCLFAVIVLGTLLTHCTITHAWVPAGVLAGGVIVTIVIRLIAGLFRETKYACFSRPENLAVLLAHALDATSTIIGIECFGYYEKHVLPSFLIDLTGTSFVMYPLKILIWLVVICALDILLTEEGEENTSGKKSMFSDIPQTRNILKFAIIILGLAPAVRNTVRIFFGI